MNSSCCKFQESALDSALPPVLLIEFVLGLGCNTLALWMMLRQLKSWKPYSVYLFSLTIADFIVLFCVLFRADYYLRNQNWIHGDIPCRILLFALSASRAAGVIFLTIIAVDRYFKILFPFHRVNNITVKEAGIFCCLLWLGMLATYSYILIGPHTVTIQNVTHCESFQICPTDFSLSALQDGLYVLMCIVSLGIISYCTVCIVLHLKKNTIDKDGKVKRAVRFVLSITFVYSICYLPSTFVRLTIWMLKFQRFEECKMYKDCNLTFYITVCFTYFYSMLNPILYYLSSASPNQFNPVAMLQNFCR
ncbi:hypothetical protein GDO86_002029, partial [Hymenochirus boettgeri]